MRGRVLFLWSPCKIEAPATFKEYQTNHNIYMTMKRLRLISMVCCALAALTFTSCTNDDVNDVTLTPEQRQQIFAQTRGSYQGRMYFTKANFTSQKDAADSMDVAWIHDTDTTLTFSGFSMEKLAAHIQNKELAEALAKAPAQPLKCWTEYYYANPITFYVNPAVLEYKDLEYAGGKHKVQVVFYNYDTRSFGGFFPGAQMPFQMQIVMRGVAVDGQLMSSYLPRPVGIAVAGKK